jgi:suppressor of G2 allele of SKP1
LEFATSMASGSKIRHEWFQTDSFVTVTVFAKAIQKEQVDIGFHEQSLSVCIHLGESDYTLELDLCHPIVPTESLYEILSTKVEIRLKKATLGLQWSGLEGQGPLTQSTPSYPSSSKKVIFIHN